MPQSPDLTKFIEAGMSFTEMRRSQARQLVAELDAGRTARELLADPAGALPALRQLVELGLLVPAG